MRSLSSWNMFIGNLTEIDLLFRSFPLLQIRPLSSMYFFPSQKLQILNFPIHLSAIKYFLWHFLWILALVMLNGILYSSWTFPCWFFPFTIYFDHRYMVVEVPWCQLLKHLLCNAGHLTLYDKMVYSPQKLHKSSKNTWTGMWQNFTDKWTTHDQCHATGKPFECDWCEVEWNIHV